MVLGIPVIASDCHSGPGEILNNGTLGRLVPVNDSGELATAIIDTLKKGQNTELLKQRAKDFDIETIAEKYIEVIS